MSLSLLTLLTTFQPHRLTKNWTRPLPSVFALFLHLLPSPSPFPGLFVWRIVVIYMYKKNKNNLCSYHFYWFLFNTFYF